MAPMTRHPCGGPRWPRVVAVLALIFVTAGTTAGGLGCARNRRDKSDLEGPATQEQADRFVRRAIRSSPEGVILLPSKRAERIFELPRLNELAQGIRSPAAACFIRRAIETMKRSPSDERGYANVPEGQAKIRARISPGGDVVRTEVLESGFADPRMPQCVAGVIEDKRWPPNDSGNNHYVDIVYWVSLGFQPDVGTDAFAEHVRREQATAGVRAKRCLQGRVDAGRYRVEGLNLVDREGVTLTNRLEPVALPDPVRQCIARAFRDIRLPRAPESFVRPISPVAEFEVTRDGTVTLQDEEWLRLVQMEDRARRARKRAELIGETPNVDVDEPDRSGVDIGEPPADDAVPATSEASDSAPSIPPSSPPPPRRPAADPGQGGLRLDLGGRRDDE